MIAIDTNILVHAHKLSSPWHDVASRVVLEHLSGSEDVGICISVMHEFLSISTNPQIYSPASTIEEAFSQLNYWMSAPTAVVLHEGPRHWSILKDLCESGDVRGSGIHDAKIAAICIEHDVRELLSADQGFSRFPQLPSRNPLQHN